MKKEQEEMFESFEGVFENSNNPMGIQKLKEDFENERNRLQKMGLAIDFDFAPINIKDLQSRIKTLQQRSKANLSHLGVFYGLSKGASPASMKLIFKGVHIDKNSDIIQSDEPNGKFDMPLICNDSAISDQQRNNFTNIFDKIHGAEQHVRGVYIRLKQGNYKKGRHTILNVLNSFLDEGCDLIKISFGYMKPDDRAPKDAGLTCFQLIFRGKKSDNLDFSSRQIFSTFDNDSGYSGPKPSCPPFCPR